LSASVIFAADPPVEVRHLGFGRDKGWNWQSLYLKVSNRSDKPRWFLLPGSGDRPPSEKTVFRDVGPPGMLIFHGERGQVAIGVSFSNFRALRLPARTDFEPDDFGVATARDLTTGFTQIVVVEAEELLVRGKVPLEKWLPFEVGVFKEERLPSGVGKKAKLESEKDAAAKKAHPGRKAEYIEAKGVRRWTVKFKNVGETFF
jgi:hypothetical protein